MLKTISIIVSGKVQGVWYRKFIQQKAIELGITGTVQNQTDGTVLITATGSEANLEKLAEWCGKGPDKAIVEEVNITMETLHEFDEFKIIRHLFG